MIMHVKRPAWTQTTDGKILGNSDVILFWKSFNTGDKITFVIWYYKCLRESVKAELFKNIRGAERFEIKDLHLFALQNDALVVHFLKG